MTLKYSTCERKRRCDLCWRWQPSSELRIVVLFIFLDICRCFNRNNQHRSISASRSLNVSPVGMPSTSRANKILPLKGIINDSYNASLPLPTTTNVVPLKVMIFIDGTWLYYSVYERDFDRDVIAQKLGRNWKADSKPNWSSLPKVACQALLNDPKSSWSAITSPSSAQPVRPIEVSRVMVYSSMHRDTPENSSRYKMFSEMSKAGFDVSMLETVGKGEKCVDIQLAVDMLYYATVPDAYDVALLLTGDRDFLPAIVRCRQKGRRVGLVTMRSGSLAFEDTANLKDYDTIFLEDYIDEWIGVKTPQEMNGSSTTTSERTRARSSKTARTKKLPKISPFILNTVINNFIEKSDKPRVSSRDIGRHLKDLFIGGRSILEVIKASYGGLYQFLYISETYLIEADSRNHIKAFWVSLTGNNSNSKQLHQDDQHNVDEKLSEDEEEFMNAYQQRPERDNEYEFTISDCELGYNDLVSHHPNATVMLPLVDIRSKTPSTDYNTLTVVELKEICREKGLKVAGKKGDLIKRIEQYVASEKEQVISKVGDLKPEKYLEMLVLEYLHASGGQATSRDVGRYLAANKASFEMRMREETHQGRPISALVELKKNYGSLNRFVQQSSYVINEKISSHLQNR